MADDDLLIRAAIRDELSAPLEDIREKVEQLGDEAAKSGRRASTASRGFDKLAGAARRMGSIVGKGIASAARYGAIGLGLLTVGVGALSYKMVTLASDAAEIESAFNTVFGRTSKQVDRWVGKMNAKFGIATHELRQAALTFGVFGKAADVPRKQLGKFSTDLAQAGLDLASFYNADPSEVFLALRSGLAGEAEPLRQFGIFISDATLKAKAAQMGLTGELTEQQKVMVRQKLIMAGLGDAQGDMARTSSGWANQMRALKGRLTDAGVAGGTLIKEALLPFAQIINRKAGPAVAGLDDNLEQYTGTVRRTSQALAKGFVKGGLSGAIRVIDRATGSQGKLSATFRTARGIFRDVGTVISGILWPAFKDVTEALPLFLSPLKIVRAMLGYAADNAEDLAPYVTALVGAFAAAKLALLAYKGALVVSAVAQGIYLAGLGGMTAAEAAATGTTWSLNAALLANPIGLVVVAVALLVGALILLWKKSDTAREIMTKAFQGIYKTIAFVAKGIISYWQFVIDLVLGGIQHLLEGIAYLDEKVGGKIPGDFEGAAKAVKGFRDTANDAFDSAKGKIDELGKKIDHIGDKKPTISVKLRADVASFAKDLKRARIHQTSRGVPEWKLLGTTYGSSGDTGAAHASHGGTTADNLSRTLAAHQRYSGSGIRVTNALVGGGGRGKGSGDHQAGRALDLVGPGLNAYAQRVRADGGYAAFHGSGSGRHLHSVPAGDTVTSRANRGASDGMTVRIEAGAIVVQADSRDRGERVARAVRDQLAGAIRDAQERSY